METNVIPFIPRLPNRTEMKVVNHLKTIEMEGPNSTFWLKELHSRDEAYAEAQWLFTLASECAKIAEQFPPDDSAIGECI